MMPLLIGGIMPLAADIPELWMVLVGFAALVFFGFLITILFQVKKFIRDAAGVKDTTDTRLTNHPLVVTEEVKFLTVIEFNKAEETRKEDRKEILKKLDEIGGALEKSKNYQAKARQRIHRRMNAHENAMYYMAGQGDSHAGLVIRRTLEKGNADEPEDTDV